ncbi:MAG: hypothetical protein QNJ92_06880 [Alphaproteobacteria bacterium]|nr:hypothetical protein [Alphaproteobacteria bacterium]
MLLAGALLVLAGMPATAQGNRCDERGAALDFLANKYDEHLVAAATGPNGQLIEFLASENGETWSVIATVNGVACMIASGEDLVIIDRQDRPEPGNPS